MIWIKVQSAIKNSTVSCGGDCTLCIFLEKTTETGRESGLLCCQETLQPTANNLPIRRVKPMSPQDVSSTKDPNSELQQVQPITFTDLHQATLESLNGQHFMAEQRSFQIEHR